MRADGTSVRLVACIAWCRAAVLLLCYMLVSAVYLVNRGRTMLS